MSFFLFKELTTKKRNIKNSLVVQVRDVKLLARRVRQVLVVLLEDLVEAEVVEVDVPVFCFVFLFF